MAVELPDIDIVNRKSAQMLLRRAALHGPKKQVPHLISISDPEDGPPQEVLNHPGRTIALMFHDQSSPRTGVVLPTRRDVYEIVKFAEVIKPGEYVMCHCNAGISRSSAAALTIIASKLEPSAQSAMDAVTEVMRIKSIIHPNKLMVSFADDILGYDGNLMRAHASTFQGGGLFWNPGDL